MSQSKMAGMAVQVRGPSGRYERTNGKVVTAKGYVRITCGPYRNWYEHRAVAHSCLKEWCPPCLSIHLNEHGMLEGFHVHHMDERKTHNCHGNLLLLQDVIHNYLSLERARIVSQAKARRFVAILLGGGN